MEIGFALPVSGSWATPDAVVHVARRAEAAGEDVDLAAMAASAPIETKPAAPSAPVEKQAPKGVLETVQSKGSDAPLCFTCGTTMRPAGSCYVCEGCGSTSGCS